MLKILTSAKGQKTQVKGIDIRKKKVKLSLFETDMTVYMGNPKKSAKKPPRTNK